MSVHVPDDPDRYFREFFPEQFRRARRHFPSGDTPAATRFTVDGVGQWTLRVAGNELQVGDGGEVALEIGCPPDVFRALFVDYPRAEVARTGAITDGPRVALRPVVLDARKEAACRRTRRSLALVLTHQRVKRQLLITPGGGDPTAPGSTVSMSFDDYLAIQRGKRTTKGLFVFRRLKIRGDLGHAVRLDPLLG